MKRTLYLDCFAGISGDMLLGALLDCGLDFELLKHELAKLGVSGYELSLTRVDRSGIAAAKFDVQLLETHAEAESVPHTHTHSHPHEHTHAHAHGEGEHSHHRALSDIKRLIAASGLSETVKARATQIFQRLGAAESKIHNIPLEAVHFHEVGALDSIVDIVGVCVGLEALQIERIIASPLHVGSGTFKCAHGTYPVPGPAATELLQGVPIYAKDIQGELVTPTGAALVAELAASFGALPLLKIERTGYGAGTREYPKFPNVLRAIIGELLSDAPHLDDTPNTITVIEANLDDLSPQVLGHVMEKALAAGALDLFYTPVQMKKNRPGVLLTLLCQPADRARMCELLFRETTTLGLRYRTEQREILQREFVTVATPYGSIRIKLAKNAAGRVVNAAPEYEDCRAAAEAQLVALREVQTAALRAYAESL
ncbi:MAG: nickel pincer cofactor biosynthesis protein LarC [Acidobacteria bacterium]|nr:nickel pincer cofactor biosynthesis protein LarC [Acidobacteriota bacterium]MBI3425041.1 nickel pincer cofactor biosynthesis protein LarC [Acidobacteriota bacterium]